jgi:hypothetical protein
VVEIPAQTVAVEIQGVSRSSTQGLVPAKLVFDHASDLYFEVYHLKKSYRLKLYAEEFVAQMFAVEIRTISECLMQGTAPAKLVFD